MKENEVEIVLGEKTLGEVPFQMSRSIGFEKRPSGGLKSQALDSLINQNEDLMARMRATALRAGELEDQMDLQSQQILSLKHERSQLREQMMILQEKENLYRDRTDGTLALVEELRQENYDLLSRIQKVERAFRRLFKYREKIRTALPDLKIFKSKAMRAHELNDHLKVQVGDLSTRLQRIHSENSEAQMKLIEDYETQVSLLAADLKEAKEKALDREDLRLEKIELENRSVELERQLLNTKNMYGQENQALKIDLEHYRKQTKELLVACETLKSQLSENIKERTETQSENARLLDQVESLQVLWRDKQNELERSQEKNKALQKLNQDISIKLNETKKEMFDLKTTLDRSQRMS